MEAEGRRTMTGYQFTQDWFSWAPEVWVKLVPLLPERTPSGRDFLEIGSFEGRSAVWIMEHMMQEDDYLTCVDTWEGGEEHNKGELNGAWERFCANMEVARNKFPNRHFSASRHYSHEHLAKAISDDHQYDFIYIDGSHIAKDVMTDACMAWPLLKPKGIMVFDDYLWGDPRDILHRPKPAIDAFVNIFAEYVEVIHVGYQLIVRKKGESK
jgi:predicted O-methyltransferase YrrM